MTMLFIVFRRAVWTLWGNNKLLQCAPNIPKGKNHVFGQNHNHDLSVHNRFRRSKSKSKRWAATLLLSVVTLSMLPACRSINYLGYDSETKWGPDKKEEVNRRQQLFLNVAQSPRDSDATLKVQVKRQDVIVNKVTRTEEIYQNRKYLRYSVGDDFTEPLAFVGTAGGGPIFDLFCRLFGGTLSPKMPYATHHGVQAYFANLGRWTGWILPGINVGGMHPKGGTVQDKDFKYKEVLVEQTDSTPTEEETVSERSAEGVRVEFDMGPAGKQVVLADTSGSASIDLASYVGSAPQEWSITVRSADNTTCDPLQLVACVAETSGATNSATKRAIRFFAADSSEKEVIKTYIAETAAGSPEAFEIFAQQHSSSPLAAEARVQAERLRNQKDDAEYRNETAAGTPEVLEQFAQAHPNNHYATEARNRASALREANEKAAIEARQREEEQKKGLEKAQYAQYLAKDTAAAYREFLEKYPSNAHAAEARTRLESLTEWFVVTKAPNAEGKVDIKQEPKALSSCIRQAPIGARYAVISIHGEWVLVEVPGAGKGYISKDSGKVAMKKDL